MVSICPFCCQGFELAWDCKILSCKHAYHSLCVITHFSSKLTCIEVGCDQEPHPYGDLAELGGLQCPQKGKFPSFILIYVVFLFSFGFIIMHFEV